MATIQVIDGDSLSTGKDKINTNFTNVNNEVLTNNQRVSDIIAQSGTSDTEVVDARGGFTVLNDRLEDVDSSLANNVTEIDKTNSIIKSRNNNINLYPRIGEELNDDGRFARAIADTSGALFLPAGQYELTYLDLPQGLKLQGATNCFFQSGGNIENLTIIKTISTTILADLKGGNVVKDMLIVYTNQTYESVTMIDTGITFNMPSGVLSGEKSRGCTFEGVNVVGGCTILNNIDYCDHTIVNGLAFTPNYISSSIILNNGFDIVRIANIQCSDSCSWVAHNGGLISSRFSQGIKDKCLLSGKLFEIGRVDELMLTNIFSYGVAFPYTFTDIDSVVANGGITLTGCVHDACFEVFTIDSACQPFGIVVNGLKAILSDRENGCIFKFTSKAQQVKLLASNILGYGGGMHFYPIKFETSSNGNRVKMSGVNFYGELSVLDSGTDNLYDYEGFGGDYGLVPLSYKRKKNVQYTGQNWDNKSLNFNNSVQVPVLADATLTTLTVALPFTCQTVPNIFVGMGGWSTNDIGKILVRVSARTLIDFEITLMWLDATKAISAGVVTVMYSVHSD